MSWKFPGRLLDISPTCCCGIIPSKCSKLYRKILELPGHVQDISMAIPRNVQELSPGNVRGISGIFPGHFLEMSSKFPGQIREMSGIVGCRIRFGGQVVPNLEPRITKNYLRTLYDLIVVYVHPNCSAKIQQKSRHP